MICQKCKLSSACKGRSGFCYMMFYVAVACAVILPGVLLLS